MTPEQQKEWDQSWKLANVQNDAQELYNELHGFYMSESAWELADGLAQRYPQYEAKRKEHEAIHERYDFPGNR